MSAHSIAEAKDQLSELIDRAMSGEDIVITRDGCAMVELKPIPGAERTITPADLDWLATRRVGATQAKDDAGSLLRKMRDEEAR